MSKKIVAIDPGLGGALAFFIDDYPYLVADMPIMARSDGKGKQIVAISK